MINRTKVNYILYIILFIFVYTTQIVSQTIERTLGQGDFEMGVDYRYFKRDFTNNYNQVRWSNYNIMLRYGFTEWLTGSFEGFAGKISQDNFPNRNYHSYRLGVGFGIKIITINNIKIILGTHYIENLDFDRSESKYHKLQKSFIVALGAQQHFNYSFIDLSIFIYPVFVLDNLFEYTLNFNNIYTSMNNFGAILGTDFIAYKHFHFIAEILYADYWQPRVGIGYIF